MYRTLRFKYTTAYLKNIVNSLFDPQQRKMKTAYLFSTHRLQWPFSRLRETESGYRFLEFAIKVLTSANPDTGADSHSLNREHSLMLSIYKINEPVKGEQVRPSLL